MHVRRYVFVFARVFVFVFVFAGIFVFVFVFCLFLVWSIPLRIVAAIVSLAFELTQCTLLDQR